MDFETIRFEKPEPGIGLITLNRPERLNAMNLTMIHELKQLMRDVSPDESVRVLMIAGEGRGFCSGADLSGPGAGPSGSRPIATAGEHLLKVQTVFSETIILMRRISQPIISVVNGHAAGGGLCLTLASDVVIAGPGALFTASFINIGLSGGELGSSYLLPRRVGTARASEIIMTGRTVDAKEAERIGLVSRLVGEGDLMAEAFNTARQMLGKSTLGLRFTKEALEKNLVAPSLEAAIALEDRNQSICCMTDEAAEAMQAFRDRKKK